MGGREQQVPPLRYPGFLWNLVPSASFMRLSLLKGAHAGLSSAAWQEIRVRSGRDDNSFFDTEIPNEKAWVAHSSLLVA